MNYVTAFLCGCGEVWELGYQEQCLFFVLVHKGESAALEDGFNLMFMSNEEIANELLVQASNYVRFTPGLLGCSISFNDGSMVRCEL